MSDVNICSQCGTCCKLFFINLDEKEFLSSKFKTIFDNAAIENFSEASECGANFLSKKKDGSCFYLKNNSCSIHNERPRVCRNFFCDSKDEEFETMRQIIHKNKIKKR